MSKRTESPPQMPQRYQLQRYKGYLLYGWGVQMRWDGTGWLAQGCICAMDSNPDEALHWVSKPCE